jgi:hypothetical protein
VGAASTAEQIAFAQAQTLAIRQDANFNGGDYYGGPFPEQGLALARRIAHITYRSAAELEGRFGRAPQAPESPLQGEVLGARGRYQVESYLDHQGNKLVQRFDANSYIAITGVPSPKRWPAPPLASSLRPWTQTGSTSRRNPASWHRRCPEPWTCTSSRPRSDTTGS